MYGWKSDRSLTLKEEHRSLATLLTRLSKEDPERDLGPVQAAIKKAVRQSIADNQIRVDEWG
jgi:formaldehyde-activating enzyme involved in methanogenesis